MARLLGAALRGRAVAGDRGLVHPFGDAEVEDFDGAGVGDHDIGGLQVAVDDAALVRADEGAYDGDDQLDGAVFREGGGGCLGALGRVLVGVSLALAEEVVEGFALEVFEDHVGGAEVLAELVDDDDVFVGHLRGGEGLEKEAGDGSAAVAADEFDGDEAAQAGVAGEEDGAHAAAAKGADDFVVLDGGARGDRGNGRAASVFLRGVHPGGGAARCVRRKGRREGGKGGGDGAGSRGGLRELGRAQGCRLGLVEGSALRRVHASPCGEFSQQDGSSCVAACRGIVRGERDRRGALRESSTAASR